MSNQPSTHDDLPLQLECPQGIKVVADEWGLGDGSTYCVTAEGEDSMGESTYVVLTASITLEAAVEAARAIHAALVKANESYREPWDPDQPDETGQDLA